MTAIVDIRSLSKVYENGHQALDDVSLQIENGEILALLGPNGAGKTTLISIICGLVTPSSGTVLVGDKDITTQYRDARKLIGLVPQEVALEPFESVINTVKFSRGLFGKPSNPALIEKILKQLSLWDKKDSRVMELSGGMKRRVLIAKALSHEPRVLFLDEPTAGVDVELRKDMWNIVRQLQKDGVTIILTTHYIEEAEAIADRVGVISGGKLLLAEDKATLMARMGNKQLRIQLHEKMETVPSNIGKYKLDLSDDGMTLTYTYDTKAERTGIRTLLNLLDEVNVGVRDIETHQSSLEEIFVDLVGKN